jgi:hypothetical protein
MAKTDNTKAYATKISKHITSRKEWTKKLKKIELLKTKNIFTNRTNTF